MLDKDLQTIYYDKMYYDRLLSRFIGFLRKNGRFFDRKKRKKQ